MHTSSNFPIITWKQYTGEQAPAGPGGTSHMYDWLAPATKYLILTLPYLLPSLYECPVGEFPMSISQRRIKCRSSSQMDLQMVPH